ncbi:MAG TPA: tetratricopeptide repeat protein, partial [Amycolatopsis sp.]|nr:tetratricopeptide repeat protein [Amycolatopsis sp.]
DRQDALNRLLTWYAYSVEAAAQVITPHFSRIPYTVAEPVAPPPDFPDRLTALRWCDAERANLVAAVSQAAEVGEHTLAWQMPVALFAYFLDRSPLADWVATHLVGLASVRRDGYRLAEAWLQCCIAIAYRGLGQYDTALAYCEQALPGWDDSGLGWGEAWVLRDIGSIYTKLGRYAEAVDKLNEALEIHIEDGDGWGEATTRGMLAEVYESLGRPGDALPELYRALEIRRAQDDQRNAGGVLNAISLAHTGLGQFDQAIAEAEEALAIHEAHDYWPGQAVAHERLATALGHLNRPEAAAEHWRAAITLYDKLADPHADEIRDRTAKS